MKTTCSVTTRNNITDRFTSKRFDSESYEKAVLQFDLSGLFLKEFISGTQAERETNICRAGIRKCCIGEYKQAGGFIWKYEEDYESSI